MRTATELIFGKGRHEYIVTGTFWIDDHPRPLDLDATKKRVEEIYSDSPWCSDDCPSGPRTATVKVTQVPKSDKEGGLFEDSGHTMIEIRLNGYPLRQVQLRSFERHIIEIEGILRAEFGCRQVVAGVQTWKRLGHY